jgi:CheY-like chemotaxis protein
MAAPVATRSLSTVACCGKPARYGRGLEQFVSKTPTRILIVDDNRHFADGLRAICQGVSRVIEVEYSSEAAVDRAAATKPRVVILDLRMPGIDGAQLLALMRTDAWAKQSMFVRYSSAAKRIATEPFEKAGFHLLVVKARADHLEALIEGLSSACVHSSRRT